MEDRRLPRILIVDDHDGSSTRAGLSGRADARALHPSDVTEDDLIWADLVLMDFVLDHWPERDGLDQVSLRPINGLALAGILREQADAAADGHDYTAFAIHSAELDRISQRLQTTSPVAHVVARLNNLEWAFDKTDSSRFESAIHLAMAVQQISEYWADVERGGLSTAMEELLGGTDGASWHARALDDVALCQVPLSEFSAETHGLHFLRWLLHSILPYPTFLWATHWVATRLRVSVQSLETVLKGESALAAKLTACRYRGILSEYLGARWWRAGVEQFVWEIRAEGARDPEAFAGALERLADQELEHLSLRSPVVCINRNLEPEGGACEIDDTVRMIPDLWPAFADSAYARLSDLNEDARFAAVVHPRDRGRVTPDESEE